MIVNKNLIKGISELLSSSGKYYIVTTLYLCNTSTSNSAIVSVYAVQAGSIVGNDSLILKDLELEPTETLIFNIERMSIEKGDAIYAKCDTDTVSATLSAVNVSTPSSV